MTYDELEKENIKYLKTKTENPNKAEVWLRCYITLLSNDNDLENVCDEAVRQYVKRF